MPSKPVQHHDEPGDGEHDDDGTRDKVQQPHHSAIRERGASRAKQMARDDGVAAAQPSAPTREAVERSALVQRDKERVGGRRSDNEYVADLRCKNCLRSHRSK